MSDEKLIFELFLTLSPDMAGECIKRWSVIDEWYVTEGLNAPAPPYDRRPDVICETESGKPVGIELKSWLDQTQMEQAQNEQRVRDNILAALGEQRNKTQNIGRVWLSPYERRLASSDANALRDQLLRLIEYCDQEWPKKPNWDKDCRELVKDFTSYPMLGKYFTHIELFPSSRGRLDRRWIGFPTRGGAYLPETMLNTLAEALLKYRQDIRYRDLTKYVDIQESYLLIHYDFNSFAFNTSFGRPGFGFKEAANFAAGVLDGNSGYFDKIFLVNCLSGQESSYRIS